jgi:hypothetical protein
MDKFRIPNFNTSIRRNPPSFEIADLEILTHNEMLEFQKETAKKQFQIAELQSKNADKQHRNNILLTILALIFAFISIVPVLREWISNDKKEQERELLIINQSKVISNLEKRIIQLERKAQEKVPIKNQDNTKSSPNNRLAQ